MFKCPCIGIQPELQQIVIGASLLVRRKTGPHSTTIPYPSTSLIKLSFNINSQQSVSRYYVRVLFEWRSRACLQLALVPFLLDVAPLDECGQMHQRLTESAGRHSPWRRSPESEDNACRSCVCTRRRDLSHHVISEHRDGQLPADPVNDVAGLGACSSSQ